MRRLAAAVMIFTMTSCMIIMTWAIFRKRLEDIDNREENKEKFTKGHAGDKV